MLSQLNHKILDEALSHSGGRTGLAQAHNTPMAPSQTPAQQIEDGTAHAAKPLIYAKYVGSFQNKVDSKGRVSIPIDFRKVLTADAVDGFLCFPSFLHPCLECGGPDLVRILMGSIGHMDAFNPSRQLLEADIFAQTQRLGVDGEGRVCLPPHLKDHATIGDSAKIVGAGHRFQIWEPAGHADVLLRARAALADEHETIAARSLPSLAGKTDIHPFLQSAHLSSTKNRDA